MNATDYTFLLSHPEAVNERQTDALEKIVTEFPYFQSARALRLKGLYNQNSFQYNYALKVTAAYTTDRSVLFDFITSDSFTAIQKGLYEQRLAEIEAITVKDSQVLDESDSTPTARPSNSELAEQSIRTSIREAENRTDEPKPQTIDEKPLEEIDAEDFGPVNEEPQFLPEAIAPVEYMHAETVEFVPVELADDIQDITDENAIVETAITEIDVTPNASSATDAPAQPLAETEVQNIEIEERLDIGKPLAFSKDETHSFQEWLQLSKLQPIVRDEEPTLNSVEPISENDLVETSEADVQADEKTSKELLIDRFIETNPKMPRVTSDVKPVEINQKEDNSALMTETLARVYLEQRKYQKAIQAYEILILKYPEKSSFFADRISEIKNLQQNNIL